MRDPWQVIYDPDLPSPQFTLAMGIIANPENTWHWPYQKYVQAFLQQDTAMRELLNISSPVLEAPNPWHMPANIRAKTDVHERFVAYTDHMRHLQPDVPYLYDR